MYKVIAPLSNYTDLELALMVLMNVFGSGETRRKNLGDRYTPVQIIVNRITSSRIIPPGKASATDEAIRRTFKKFEPTSEDYTEFIDEFLNALKEDK